jgi:hypothetical protein
VWKGKRCIKQKESERRIRRRIKGRERGKGGKGERKKERGE